MANVKYLPGLVKDRARIAEVKKELYRLEEEYAENEERENQRSIKKRWQLSRKILNVKIFHLSGKLSMF